jgi:membrane protease YdiL (CAAX protease family)
MPTSFRNYLDESRELYNNILLVLPLFVIYQIGILATGGVRNGVDFVTDILFWASGHSFWGYVGINLGVLVAFGGAVAYLRQQGGESRFSIWPWMIAESTLYAFLLGGVIIGFMSQLGLDHLLASGAAGISGPIDKLVLSIGAGIYEELVFRLFLMGGLFWVGKRSLGWSSWVAASVAVLASSLLFSGVHYIGSLGDAFEMGSFLYRFFAGILFAVIFYLRGFAIAVYTHAIYDIFVLFS